MSDCHWSLAQGERALSSASADFVTLAERGTMSLELYAPQLSDTQQPHQQDEMYVVQRGQGTFVNGASRHEFARGDALFVAAGVEHRFETFSDDFLTWVVFWGPAGGEQDTHAHAPPWRWQLDSALAGISAQASIHANAVFEHGSLALKVYAPRGSDPQTPHTVDELYFVQRGHGRFSCDDVTATFGSGDVLFAPANREHRFSDFSDDLALWVVFYGPHGGEL